MDPVSLTTFVDFVSKAGSPKLTVVRKWKHRDYKPETDFYKRIRERVIELHRDNRPASFLDAVLAGLSDSKKQQVYPALVEGHRRWCRAKKTAWFDPPSALWRHGDLAVNVNPELGLEINGAPHLVKLYFKAEKLAPSRVAIVTHMMDIVCCGTVPDGCQMAVLDLRRGRLLTGHRDPDMESLLRGEAAYWMAVWPDA